jgi:two-component system chemotaxis sensor kinase CheA
MSPSEKEFIAETEELLEEAVSLLLSIQDSHGGQADPQSVNALFRTMHTIKGMAGIYGHHGLMDLSHSLEYLLDDVRMGKAAFSDDVIDFLFRYVDALKSIVEGIKGKEKRGRKKKSEEDVSVYLDAIKVFRESLKVGGEDQEISGIIDKELLKVLSEYEEHRLKSNIREGKGIYFLKAVFSLTDFDAALKDLSEKIRKTGEIISTMPTSEGVSDGSIGFNIMVGTSEAPEKLKMEDFVLETLVEKKEGEEKPEKTGELALGYGHSARISSSTVRVDIGKLDRIINTLEEISRIKGTIKRIWTEMAEVYGHSPLLIDMFRVGQNLERRVGELQHQVLEIRMVPIGQMFARLTQVIRRYARDVGKKINLGLFGQETEIDKYLAEEVMDPLVHVVRNAIDHGLEHAKERIAAGKDETGSVTLRAFQRGNNVVIEVQDDGNGIDIEKIRNRAVEKGIMGPAEKIEEKELLDLISTPGLSTKDVVSEVSGRRSPGGGWVWIL